MTGVDRAAPLALLLAIVGTIPARAQRRVVDRGSQLFTGATRFARGGPACAVCHDSAALSRPGGGTMGPDLTDVAARMGPQGVETALQTLYFPTMTPLFSAHPLTADERQAIAAFLETAPQTAPRTSAATLVLGVTAVVTFALLMVVTAYAGRTRIQSVRLALLARAAAARKAAS